MKQAKEHNVGEYLRSLFSSVRGKILHAGRKIILTGVLGAFIHFSGYSQLKDCRDCYVPSFQAFTLYYSWQPGATFGFGFEAGNWNKDDSRFSYFLGSRLQWFQLNPNSDKFSNSADNIRFSFYVKGQARIVDRLYFVASPEFVNLTSFDLALGLRYIYPLSESIGIGLEPTYSALQKEYSLNANIHLAL